MLCMLKTSEMFVLGMSKIYKNVFAHNLLNIQQIVNPEKVLKS